ncbi:MAG: hypothetical protein OXH70_15460 [Acidobacteria bacterium]|nr:hypothetical protein [Acidobacteriota bacterium]
MARTRVWLLLVLVGSQAWGQEVLTNETIVALADSGRSEPEIRETIQSSATHFDTSSEALTALDTAGVPPGVIVQMVRYGSRAREAREPLGEFVPPVQTRRGAFENRVRRVNATGYCGGATLFAIVDERGRTSAVRDLSGELPEEAREILVDAVRRMRFRPATLSGRPSAATMYISLNFADPEQRR